MVAVPLVVSDEVSEELSLREALMPSSELLTVTSRILMYCASMPSLDFSIFRVPPEISRVRGALSPSSPAETVTDPALSRVKPMLSSSVLVDLMPSCAAVTLTIPPIIST